MLHLRRRLPLHLCRDGRDVLPPVLLTQAHKLVEVLAVPRLEALRRWGGRGGWGGVRKEEGVEGGMEREGE